MRFSWLLLCIPGLLLGQSAELSGLVKDPSGGTVANATIELREQNTGIRQQENTNREGFYSFASLKPGTYQATVQASKFRTLTQEPIVLDLAERASLDFTLQLPVMTQSVTVNSDPPLLNSTDPAVSTLLDQQVVQNMPLNGRTFQSLIALTPGVAFVPTGNSAGGPNPGQFSVNGQRANANYFMVDGVSANFGVFQGYYVGQSIGGALPGLNAAGATNGLVSVDAIREIRVLTSTYAPEYGRSPGAQVLIVTRSGTNQFHGSAFEYLRNEIFDARNFFNVVPQPKPPLRQNDFGGTLGGPIHKNKAFFFFSYEGLRLRLPQTSTGTFFTAAARENVAPVFQPLLAALPVPNGPTNPDGITASLTASYSNPSNLNATSVRIDYNLTDRVTLFGRYNHAPSDFVDRYFSELEDFSVNTDTATVGLTILVSPTRLNEFRVNWSRQTGDDAYRMDNFYGAVPPAAVALYPPAYRLSDLFEFYSPDIDGQVGFGNFAANVQKQWNLVDTFSLTAVAHQLKFGLDFRRLNLTNGVSNWLTISSSYAQMQAGIAGSISQNAHASIPTRANDYSAFAQDIWKILPSLTLTYGLRWDVNTPPVSMAPAEPLYALSGIFDSKPFGLVPATSLWHTRLNNFAPRIGAAWQLTPKTVLRGGFGLFYDLGYGGGIAQTLNSFPYDRSSVLTNIPLDLNNPALTPPTISLTLNSSIAYLWAVDQHLRTPLTFEWNGTIEHALGSNQRLSASYLGAHGRNLLREDDIPQPPAGYPRVIATLNSDWSDYSALQVQFQRRMTRGLQALISYTFAKSTDTNSSDVCQCTFTNMLSNVNPAADLGPSDFDQRNAFAAAVSYQVPAPPGRPGHLLLGNWRADALVRSSSALPFGVWTFVSSPVIGYYLTRPNVVPGVPFYLPDANNPGGRVLNAAAFSAPGPGQYGNLPRNYFRGFPINQTDIALSRYFRVSERISLSARVEYFNVFNHPMFFYPDDFNNRLGLSSFGLVTQTLNNSLGSPLGGGLNPLYQVGGPRSAQFNLKLDF